MVQHKVVQIEPSYPAKYSGNKTEDRPVCEGEGRHWRLEAQLGLKDSSAGRVLGSQGIELRNPEKEKGQVRTGSPRQTCRCANCLIGAGTTQKFAYIYGAPNSESSSTKRTAFIGSSGGVSRLLTPIFRLNNIKKNFYSATDFDEARNRNVKVTLQLGCKEATLQMLDPVCQRSRECGLWRQLAQFWNYSDTQKLCDLVQRPNSVP